MLTVRNIFLASFPAVFLIFNTGCSHLGSYRFSRYSEAPAGQLLLSSAPRVEDSAYFSGGLGSVTERDKIRYLLDRVAQSNQRFIRNGEAHDSKEARQWLLYKMSHWVNGVETAQDFVARVASFSQASGKPYLVEFPNGQIYTLSSVLKNELSVLEIRITQFHQERAQETLPKPGQVSLSHPAAPAPN